MQTWNKFEYTNLFNKDTGSVSQFQNVNFREYGVTKQLQNGISNLYLMTCGKTMETKVALFQIFGTNVGN